MITPTLSPLGDLADALAQDVAALDVHADNLALDLTGDEICELATTVALLTNIVQHVRDVVTAIERRQLREAGR